MSGVKDAQLERQENHYIGLARSLGITWEELSMLDYDIHANVSSDGLVYNYLLTFDKDCDLDILDKIPNLSSDYSVNVAPWELDQGAENRYELEAITYDADQEKRFLNDIENIEKLRLLEVNDQPLRRILLRQLFIAVIGALETYLSDTFINETLESDDFLRNFIASNPEFKKQKITLSEVLDVDIKQIAKTAMIETIYHKLPVVKNMYEQTFGIQFPNISNMQRYVRLRHDLVHRYGKTTDGKPVDVTDEIIKSLCSESRKLVTETSEKLRERRHQQHFSWFDDDIPF